MTVPGARQVRLVNVSGAHVLLGALARARGRHPVFLGHATELHGIAGAAAPGPPRAHRPQCARAPLLLPARLPRRRILVAARAPARSGCAARTTARAAACAAASDAARSPARARSPGTAPSRRRTAVPRLLRAARRHIVRRSHHCSRPRESPAAGVNPRRCNCPSAREPQRRSGCGEQHARAAQRAGGRTVEQQRVAPGCRAASVLQHLGRDIEVRGRAARAWRRPLRLRFRR